MDAKEHVKLRNNDEVSWLRMIDECRGAAAKLTTCLQHDDALACFGESTRGRESRDAGTNHRYVKRTDRHRKTQNNTAEYKLPITRALRAMCAPR